MLILDIERRLREKDCNRHLRFSLNIDREAKGLKVFFKYSPPYLEDKEQSRKMIEQAFIDYIGEVDYDKVENYMPLRNLLTISITSPNGPIGTAHRHLKHYEHYINDQESSRGFSPTKIVVGRWDITVAVFSVLTEYVDMQLRVEAIYD